MAYLSEAERAILTADALAGTDVSIVRPQARCSYRLQEVAGHGMKGVVWRALDDLGSRVAFKFTPKVDYSERSLFDEMTEAIKLPAERFVPVKFFGRVESPLLEGQFVGIVTEWVEGEPLDSYFEGSVITVDEFVGIAELLFSLHADLESVDLCHDDLHPGNVLMVKQIETLTRETSLALRVIDTGTIKRRETRDLLLSRLRERLTHLKEGGGDTAEVDRLAEFLSWKELDDHQRLVGCLLHCANALSRSYPRADFWERHFIDDGLSVFFDRLLDDDMSRRLDEPRRVVAELRALRAASQESEVRERVGLISPFDYISAEMIQNDKEFSDLFSMECPWLEDCRALEPIYLYGPRGCGKSSVLRWLSFKAVVADEHRRDLDRLADIGVYVSCSVELRSRFWLLDEDTILELQAEIIDYFSLLLLEGLFETLLVMDRFEREAQHNFRFRDADIEGFTTWVLERVRANDSRRPLRLQGQSHLGYMRDLCRKLRWETWGRIQSRQQERRLPDPSLVIDVCRRLPDFIQFFRERHVTFLLDDYSNQRIPPSLQRVLNQTISFAKQGTPIFKVSTEYSGVDLEGIEYGREVVEVNVGAYYTSISDERGVDFLRDILDLRLRAAGYAGRTESLLGFADYGGSMPKALAGEGEGAVFYYHGIETIHQLCSGDVALALDLVRKIFERGEVDATSTQLLGAAVQHRVIQEYGHKEIHRLKYIVPYGSEMHDIVAYLGSISRASLKSVSRRADKSGEPVCKTHLDVRIEAVRELEAGGGKVLDLYRTLTAKSVLISLETSRSRIAGSTERLQMKRIYFPAFKAPLKRDAPIKIDSSDELVSLLTNPKAFAERELARFDIGTDQLRLALEVAQLDVKES